MKELLKNLLFNCPSLLADLMRLKSNWNRDKYIFLKLLSKGDNVLDVGGNIGDYCTTFAKVVGSSGQVHTFEPVPTTFETLKETVARKRLGNVTLNQMAVTNESGQIEIHMPGDDHARPSIQKHSKESWDQDETIHTFSCEATTLEKYALEKEISRLDFIKIDVEGAEFLVLTGGKAVLRSCAPILFFEMWEPFMKDFNTSAKGFCQLLRDTGYDQFLIVQEDLHPLSNLEDELPQYLAGGILNLVCGKKSKHAKRFASIKTRHM